MSNTTLWEKTTYTVDIPYIIAHNIYEYDIRKANINVLLALGLIDKDYYYKINSDVSYNIIYSKEEFKDDFQDTTSFIKFAKMSEVRTKLVSQLIRDYKRGYSDTVASEITLNNYYKKEIDSKYLKLVKNED